ncbi:MAG: tRNA (adenine-N1)-methyltransferase [Chloroflexota bacterium]|nr:tRNA (adenine-N1)-methyltransferase [Chloroflexota bacterium]
MAEPTGPAGARSDAGYFADGDQVLLLDRAGNRRLIRLQAGAKAHGHKGYLEHDRMIGEPEGVTVRSSSGTVYVAVRPRLADYALEMPRRTAIVYPKDVGIILVWADIFPGATVFEAGFGSGSLTLALLRAVGPSGRVVVYELRPDVIPAALANIRGFDEPRGELAVHQRDVYEGIDERDVDRLVLDVPEPWRVVPHAADALRPGGIAAFYSPSIIQVHRTVEALEVSRAFGQIESLEVLYRPWQVKGQAVRPVQQMVSHTAFLTFARRLKIRGRQAEAESEAEAEITEAATSEVGTAAPDIREAEIADADLVDGAGDVQAPDRTIGDADGGVRASA